MLGINPVRRKAFTSTDKAELLEALLQSWESSSSQSIPEPEPEVKSEWEELDSERPNKGHIVLETPSRQVGDGQASTLR